MLTPQEIQDQKFEKAVFGGYDMGQIDRFLDTVLEDYSSLYKENAALKSKMRVLVDKIEEYRAVDEELRKTLYHAQLNAKDAISRANSEAERIIRDAQNHAAQHANDLRDETAQEEARLATAKINNLNYAEKIRRALEQSILQMNEIMNLSRDADAAQTVSFAQPESQPEIQPDIRPEPQTDSRPDLTDPEDGQYPGDPTLDEDEGIRIFDDGKPEKPRFDFSDLRFGKEFDDTVSTK